jgi:uncharacterized protein with HEPN domain
MSPRKWQNRIQDILDAIAETRAFVDGYTYPAGSARPVQPLQKLIK